MSTLLRKVGTGAGQILTLGVLLLLARSAWSIEISPSPSHTGDYTVSSFWTGCYEDWTYYPDWVGWTCYYLAEQTGAGELTTLTTGQGATSWSVVGKAPGTYIYYVYQTYGYGDQQIVDGPVSVTVGTPPPRDPLLTQLNYQFEVRQGDVNFDGRTDLFVSRISGGVPGNGVLDAAILRQSAWNDTFSAAVPAGYESSMVSTWPLSSASIVVTDFNVDGFVDVEIKGVAAATGMSGAADQIVFSSGVPLQAQPLGVRAVDESLKRFVGNMLDYIVNPTYFDENANVTYSSGATPYLWCDWNSFFGIWDGWHHGTPPCTIGYYYWESVHLDYSALSSAAVAIWSDEQSFVGGTLQGAQSTEHAQQITEGELGVQIGGWPMEEVLGTAGEHSDANVRRGLETFWAILGIGRANAQEVETVEAPRQVPRTYGIVYVTAHHVVGRGPQHTAIEFRSGLAPTTTTISAGPEWRDSRLMLVSTLNRASDRHNMTVGTVQDPSNPHPDSYFAELLAADSNYDNDLLYDPFPVTACCFNSNGYTHGVINATGGVSSVDLHAFVGGSHPVPPSAFQ